MEMVVDTSVLVAVVAAEQERRLLIERTHGATLVAPASVHWEVGNAFAAMLKRRRLTLAQTIQALTAYAQIPIRYVDVELVDALRLADELKIYAYDAYVIACAQRQRCELITLDRGLMRAATTAGVGIVEVET